MSVHENVTDRTASESDVSGVTSAERAIPALAHFIWYGPEFPWVNALAIRSALERGGFERVVLHCDQPLVAQAHFAALRAYPAFEARPIDAAALLPRELLAIYTQLAPGAARANVLRAAILAREGGVYLDMDTITLRALDDLRAAGVFCGQERVAFPAQVMRDRNPPALARALVLHGLRAACRRLPDGVALFRRIESLYPLAVNNAVLGAAPGHRFVQALLAAMLALPPERRLVRYALGTHLLQAQVAEYAGADLRVHPPELFYPLGPEISHHWFRTRGRADVAAVISAQTRVVHWYASVENRALAARIDPDYVRRHAGTQLFSALAEPFAR